MLVKHIPHSCRHIPSKYRKNFYLVMMIAGGKYSIRTGIPKNYSQMMSLTKLFSQFRELFVTRRDFWTINLSPPPGLMGVFYTLGTEGQLYSSTRRFITRATGSTILFAASPNFEHKSF